MTKRKYNKAPRDDYTIAPIKGQKTYNFADTLPQHPSRMLLVGASQLSGKSTVLFSLLSKRFPYFTFYGAENIYIICPTIRHDHRWRKFKIPMENISEEWNMDFINTIQQKVEESKRPSLLVCDDIIPLQGTRKENAPFEAIFTRGRHYGENKRTGGGLAIWVTTQYYKALSPTVRGNCSNLCLWLSSDAEALKMYEEHSNGLTKADWMYIYKYCVLKEHSFLHINYSNSNRMDGRFCLRFEKVLQFTGHEDEEIETTEYNENQINEAADKADLRIKENNPITKKVIKPAGSTGNNELVDKQELLRKAPPIQRKIK